ncbi:MAG: response regulator transcription factor [Chitinophagaceae bacterium]|nr:response regulator transcription factor [Chitinophagaceae bacterium]
MTSKKIYVADDDDNILELMNMILKGKGFDVITSSDGKSLNNLGYLPDMVFLDIGMSGSDGSEICKEFKSGNGNASTPVVLVSANANLKEIAKNCGADDVLPKPFDIKAVVELAHKYTCAGNK